MKKKLSKVLQIVGVLLLILIFLKFCGRDVDKVVNPEYWESEHFKTDTFILGVPYDSVRVDTFKFKIPPKVIIQYLPSSTEGIGLINEDSLIKIIDSLKNSTFVINHDYLKLYPDKSKLIKGYFNKDTISLDLLAIDGKIQSLIYPVNYEKFKYQFLDNQMRADEVENQTKETKAKNKIYSNGLYSSVGYSLFEKKPIVALDYQLRFKKVQLGFDNTILLSKTPTLAIEVKLGYRIK